MMTPEEATNLIAHDMTRCVNAIIADIQQNAWRQGIVDAICIAVQDCDPADMAACLRITDMIKSHAHYQPPTQ
jgi:hypothetical protein